jgi:hypothetical protein
MKILGIVAVAFSLAGCSIDHCVTYLDRYSDRKALNEVCMYTPACQLTTEDIYAEYQLEQKMDMYCGKRNK